MKHALVVGGTGMLSDVSIWLVSMGYHTSVICRNYTKMDKLIKRSIDRNAITPLFVDYTNKEELEQKLLFTTIKNGEIGLIVAWIHPYAKSTLKHILRVIKNDNIKVFHILNSRSDLKQTKSYLSIPEYYLYRQIQLGFIVEGDYSRWLTHEEIAKGILESIQNDIEEQIIGVVHPWEKRPQRFSYFQKK
ncbi:short-chain dehydrogenase [Lysinibacillus sp. Bpr_S20]|uniref:short-chain dehydrogenase n=1 Tax=Lysinibacillus sp. Bpr_S20 TaxID=2933964 RepID=UPI002012F829|nr:short-chain dehydrogenase [Lysinibacillus sp. Bpr_S20]MCL1702967.1 short-chain dehydrogenase [Lysinibacillus sp. Bpr_S20]